MTRIITLILITAAVSVAQLSEKLTLRIFGGATLPQESFVGQSFEFAQFGNFLEVGQSTSNFEDYWNQGFNLGFGFDYQVLENFSAGIEFGANFFDVDEDKFESGFKELLAQFDLPYNRDAGAVEEGSTEIYTLLLSLKASYPLSAITPYLRLNGGYMFVSQQALKITYFDQPFGSNEDAVFFYDELPAQNGTIMTGSVGVGLEYRFIPTVASFVELNYTLGLNTSYDNVGASTLMLPLRFGVVFSFQE